MTNGISNVGIITLKLRSFRSFRKRKRGQIERMMAFILPASENKRWLDLEDIYAP